MFASSSYTDIFAQRGPQYQEAMERWPAARDAEFAAIIADAELAPGLVLLDAPAGGGYLSRYIAPDVQVLELETTTGFHPHATATRPQILCSSLDAVPLADACADRVVSVAGLHHAPERSRIYREFARLLRPGGIFALADVAAHSPTAAFLNEFVHRYCPMGHCGDFFGAELPGELQDAGFHIVADRRMALHWRFDNCSDMVDFCRLLFGLDLADTPTVLAGITHYLGYEKHTNGIAMNWELRYVQAIRL